MVVEVIVVENQLTEKPIIVAADKAMVETNLTMAVAENLVTDEMKVTDAGVVVGMVTNLSSRLVLDEEGMGMVMVDMDRGILRKDAGSVWLWSSPLQGLLAFSPIIRHSHVTRISQLSHPHTTNIRIQSYSPKLRIKLHLSQNLSSKQDQYAGGGPRAGGKYNTFESHFANHAQAYGYVGSITVTL